MTVSVRDLFSVGVGPSSSHTVGPMKAGLAFAAALHARWAGAIPAGDDSAADGDATGSLAEGAVTRGAGVTVILYGSLAATGAGHGTLGACLLGLDGADPATVDPDYMVTRLDQIRRSRTVHLHGDRSLPVTCGFEDIILRPAVRRTIHTNAVTFSAMGPDGVEFKETYYSIGGGFIRTADEEPVVEELTGDMVFGSAAELVDRAHRAGSVAAVQRECELSRRSEAQLNDYLDHVVEVMDGCVKRGISATGALPGGLMVRRRAGEWYRQLTAEDPMHSRDFALDRVNLVAMAVNEENAGGGRVVTAPTNGAAGIIPAVLFYARRYTTAGRDDERATWRRFLLAAGAVGSLYKERASISGAEVGCQGEVGSASSMAAAGLAEVLGGTPEQVSNAAEIGMEHLLGLTCDPVGGLVQVPCIERNAISAAGAVTAARMAMRGDGSHRVSLDEVIETMRQTGADMSERYKETAGGGLAVNVAVNVPEC
jgi:L-serine dehydratase